MVVGVVVVCVCVGVQTRRAGGGDSCWKRGSGVVCGAGIYPHSARRRLTDLVLSPKPGSEVKRAWCPR